MSHCLHQAQPLLIWYNSNICAFKQAHLLNVTIVQRLRAQGLDFHFVYRGGALTFHGPGQANMYPIVSLKKAVLKKGGHGPHRLVKGLEEVMVRVLGVYGVHGHRHPAPPEAYPGKQLSRLHEAGVWVGDRKIGAVGLKTAQSMRYVDNDCQ